MEKIKILKRKVKELMVNFFYKIYSRIYTQLVIQVNRLVKKNSLNIGGGPYFCAIGWLNLEEVKSRINISPFKLTPNCIFPLDNGVIKNVYASHCLEHLDSNTAKRVLEESLRVLENKGKLVIKIPDFDLILNAWRNNDALLFKDELWDYGSVVPTWKNRNIIDCLDYRAAMLFCGFWNKAYGDHFGRKIAKNRDAYHGPPTVEVPFLRKLISDHTPWQISSELSRIVVDNEQDYHFNHRNAWSRSELGDLLKAAGFQVVTFDKEKILNECRHFPGIEDMKEQSLYCWSIKR